MTLRITLYELQVLLDATRAAAQHDLDAGSWSTEERNEVADEIYGRMCATELAIVGEANTKGEA